ncbi:MAG: pyridoxal phosphate-dependent aminotransferase family protein [Planctomycetes bacterium]|nr:pyridoxal phosphate-dependent aminotransferase family protein [Planctomycetota bacterium]
MDLFRKLRNFKEARELEESGRYPYFKAISSGPGAEVVVDGRSRILIGSNNYLGLTEHPKVKAAAIRAIEKYGSGCTGSRFLNGTLDLHVELEAQLARFMKKEGALVFTTGFQTNEGTIATIVGKDDVVIIDRDSHASIYEGCRLAFGRTIKFRHNDMDDLERILNSLPDVRGGVLVVTEGVFSMEGDLGDLPTIVDLKRRYGFRLMVDDAHGIGYMGKHGRGTCEHFGVEDDVDLIMGTFSKSFASVGGFIAGGAEVLHYIQHHSRALIFSASMPPASVATVLAAIDVIRTEPERRDRLWANVRRMKTALTRLGFDTGGSESAVIPVIVGDRVNVFEFWRALFDAGLFTNPIVPPAVPHDQARIRTSYMATHTAAELDQVLATFGRLGKEFGLV